MEEGTSMSVRAKILICLGVLLLVGVALVLGAIRLANQQAESAAQVSRVLTERVAPARELVGLAKDIRYHVVQVQQYLTDASATHELTDDEKDAAEHAAAFDTDTAQAAQVARAMGNDTALGFLEQVRKALLRHRWSHGARLSGQRHRSWQRGDERVRPPNGRHIRPDYKIG
jgi:methyl-accepting chemotaxis protein